MPDSADRQALGGEGPFSSAPTTSTRGRVPSLIDPDWLADDAATSRPTDTAIDVPAQLRGRDKALLTVISGFNAGQVYSVDVHEALIGRGREASFRIEDAGVSRTHSRVFRASDGSYWIEDRGSTNGTFVGGKKIDKGPLNHGDLIQIGPNVTLSFAILDESEERLKRQLYESSTRDALTSAFNRKYFAERLGSEVAYAHRHLTKVSVILFDLDHFKLVNDTYGHLAGDEVLKAVSTMVTRLVRTEDVFARFGGEEFIVLARGIEHSSTQRFAERIRRSIEKLQVAWETHTIRPTISAGAASLHECAAGSEATPEDLVGLADSRLYEAKRGGRNRVVG